jgi:PhnB protein
MAASAKSEYEGVGLRAVRPYLLVGRADEAIDFYRRVFDATELERHTTPTGGVGHAKLRVGETILEIGEHPDDAAGGTAEKLPRIGLRLYVADVDETYARAVAAGATGAPPSDRPHQGSRGADVYDPFGVTWWLAAPLA